MAYQAELMTGFLVKKTLSIDEESIIFDDTQMMCAEITGFAYGATETHVSVIKANTEHYFRFIDSSGDEIKFSFIHAALGSANPLDAQDRIIEEIWKSFGHRIMEDTIRDIANGKTVMIENVAFSKYGVTIPYRPIFGKNRDVLVDWYNVGCEIEMGIVSIFPEDETKVKANFHLQNCYNAHIVLQLFARSSNDPDLFKVLSGQMKYSK